MANVVSFSPGGHSPHPEELFAGQEQGFNKNVVLGTGIFATKISCAPTA
jgi:hypothetical protein